MNKSIEWVPKGWGGEKIIENNNLYCGKILYFLKNYKCSVHYHIDKTETFFILNGKILVYYTDELDQYKKFLKNSSVYTDFLDSMILEKGDKFHLPPFRVHQMIALEDSEILEISTQDKDSDSIRLIKGD